MFLGLVIAGVAAFAGASAAARLVGPEDTADRIVLVGTFASAWCVVSAGVTGVLGVLDQIPLVASTVLVATVLWVLAPTPARSEEVFGVWRIRLRAARRHRWAALLVVLASLALAWQVLVALVLPPYAFDGIGYHLTIVADWVQRGDLARSDLSLCCASYPLGADLVTAWTVALDGRTSLADLVQLPHVLLASAAVAGLARSSGVRRPGAAAAAAMFVATPIVLVQAPTNMVDVVVVAWTLAGLHWLTRFSMTGDGRRLLLVGLSAGLVLGTKGTGVLWAAALTIAAIGCVVWSARTERLAGAHPGRAVVSLLLIVAVVGGPWYVRNWVETGNPMYPFAVEVAGTTVFDGPFDVDEVLTEPPGGADEPTVESIVRSWAADLTVWRQPGYDYQQRSGGLGPLFVWIGLPATALVGVWALRRRSPLLWLGGITAVVFAVQPYRWWSRFTIPLAALAVVAVVLVMQAAPRPARALLKTATVGLVAIGVALASHRVDPAARAEPISAVDVLDLVGDGGEARSLGVLFHPEYRFATQLPSDARVKVDLRAAPVRFVSPVFGAGLTRDVEPLRSAEPPEGWWVVTGRDRPVDRVLASDPGWRLFSDVDDLRVWRPV